MRISMVGTSGSGKSTVGRAAAERLGVPFLELDSIRHQAGWVELPDDEFRRRTAEFVGTTDGWVVDGNYSVVRDLVHERATVVVWLDLPRRRVMWQVTTRTLGRMVLRRELWNGNREHLRNLFNRDPLENIILWAWTSHASRRERYAAMVDERWVILHSRRDVKRWLAGLSEAAVRQP